MKKVLGSILAVAVIVGLLISGISSLGCGSGTKDTTPPSIPTNMTKTSPGTNNTPTFTWTAASDTGSGVAHYLVRIGNGEWQRLGAWVTTNS